MRNISARRAATQALGVTPRESRKASRSRRSGTLRSPASARSVGTSSPEFNALVSRAIAAATGSPADFDSASPAASARSARSGWQRRQARALAATPSAKLPMILTRSRPGRRAGQPGVQMMPVLVTMKRKRGFDWRAAIWAHSWSVDARPRSARRFDSVMRPAYAQLERPASGFRLWRETIDSKAVPYSCHNQDRLSVRNPRADQMS
jgi:hypothetical protein